MARMGTVPMWVREGTEPRESGSTMGQHMIHRMKRWKRSIQI